MYFIVSGKVLQGEMKFVHASYLSENGGGVASGYPGNLVFAVNAMLRSNEQSPPECGIKTPDWRTTFDDPRAKA
jgi:hypothetical protein